VRFRPSRPPNLGLPTDFFRVFWQSSRRSPIIRNQPRGAVRHQLLEQNLVRIIEPSKRVDPAHVAEIVKQPVLRSGSQVTGLSFLLLTFLALFRSPHVASRRLSQMILDKVFHGILEPRRGVLDCV